MLALLFSFGSIGINIYRLIKFVRSRIHILGPEEGSQLQHHQ